MGKLFAVRQMGDGTYTKDAASKDLLLTTSARLTAEPANKVAPGDLGVRVTGNAGRAPQQVDTDAIYRGLEANITKVLGLLSASDVAKIKASLAKYCGSEGGRTNAVGVTASDNGMFSSQVDVIRKFNADSDAFWNEKHAETDRAIFGR